MKGDILLIGADGGASKVNCWSIEIEESESFFLGSFQTEKAYSEYPEYDPLFKPVDLKIQLAERESGRIKLTEKEIQQGQAYTSACADGIIEIAWKSNAVKILVGIGMPGLKTENQRGISAMANGPRIIDYADRIEKLVSEAGIELAAPIAHIGSDAYYCGLGEEYAKMGQFRNVRNSYYLGGGTGAADALKLAGRLVSLDDIKDWFVKAWEMKCPEGRSVEKYVSSRGIQSIFGEFTNQTVADLNAQSIYPPQIREKALNGDTAAQETLERVAKYLALLIYERITTLFAGWQGYFDLLNPNRSVPHTEHPYKKSVFDNIIIGQRLGNLLKESKNDHVLWNPLIQYLNMLIQESSILDEGARNHYCPAGQFSEERIVISKLREAPVLGAGIDAWLNNKEEL
ncbi:MAG: ROK family protein [Candidatus Marinimicrobia bacterium]|nr:ROK family protein [Candidatus Neomarinimicrobiota bacterium]